MIDGRRLIDLYHIQLSRHGTARHGMGFTAVARTTGDERVLVHLLIQTFILLHAHGHLTETLQMSHPSLQKPSTRRPLRLRRLLFSIVPFQILSRFRIVLFHHEYFI
jgi:hypothetical protein